MTLICESICTSVREHSLKHSLRRGIDINDYVYQLNLDGTYRAVFV